MSGDGMTSFMQIRAAQELARLNGHTGDPTSAGNIVIKVGPGATVPWSAALGRPVTGVRTDFEAAGLFFCTDTVTSKNYVFAGYEPAATTP